MDGMKNGNRAQDHLQQAHHEEKTSDVASRSYSRRTIPFVV